MSIEPIWLIANFNDWIDVVVNDMPWAATVWITVVGGCIGSFMNVVIYRLPAGMSLVHPPSHCPKCEKPIRARDNLPVVGWLMLRGRCRDCRTAIPPRYPLVEAAVALTFLLLWLVDVVWPGVVIATHVRVGVFGLDALLLCTLICIALIDMDGQVIPWRLLLPAVVVLMLVTWLAPYLFYRLQRHQAEMAPMGGLIVGTLLGGTLGWLSTGCRRGGQHRSPIVAAALTGAYLSWIAVSLFASVTTVFYFLQRRLRKHSAASWTFPFTLITLTFLVCDPWVLPPRESLSVRLGMAIVAIALTTISGRLGRD